MKIKLKELVLSIIFLTTTAHAGMDFSTMSGSKEYKIQKQIDILEEYVFKYHKAMQLRHIEKRFKNLCDGDLKLEDKIYQKVVIINMLLKKKKYQLAKEEFKKLLINWNGIKNVGAGVRITVERVKND